MDLMGKTAAALDPPVGLSVTLDIASVSVVRTADRQITP